MRSPVEEMLSSWNGEQEEPLRAGNDIGSCGVPKAVIEHALAASCAAYEKTVHAATTTTKNLLSEDCSCTFFYPSPNCSFLILKSSQGVFIAFPGTNSISDVLCNLSLQLQPWASAGLLHWGFSERASKVPLETILEAVHPPWGSVSPPRLTLCGHSLGGAVAQIVLLRLLALHTTGLGDSSAAISFGGPFFCDKVAADVINAQHSRRLITFVNRDDVVPRVFHSPAEATADPFMDSLFGVVGAPPGSTFNSKAEGLTHKSSTSAKPEEEPSRACEPVGTYTFLRSSHVVTALAGSAEFQRAIGQAPGGSGLNDHLLASYQKAIFHSGKVVDDVEPLEAFLSGKGLVDDKEFLEEASAALTATMASLAMVMEGAPVDLHGRFPPIDLAKMFEPQALELPMEESPSTKTGACSCFPSRRKNKVHSF